MKRSKPLRRTLISKLGKMGKRNKIEDAKTKKELISLHGLVWFDAHLGGCSGPIDVHHLKTKAAHPELRHDHLNL